MADMADVELAATETVAGYTIRAATLADVAGATEVLRADEAAYSGRAVITEELVRGDWSTPDRDLSRDAWVAVARDGRIVATSDVGGSGGVSLWGGAVVHPDHTGHGLGNALLVRIEVRAHELAANAPQGVRCAFQTQVSPRNAAGRALLEARGYNYVRTFWEMGIDLTAWQPVAPTLPPNLRIRALVPGEDDRATHAAVEEAFADHWGHTPRQFDEWRHWVLENAWSDPSLLFLVVEGEGAAEQIAGFALCNQIFGPEMGTVGTLGVRRPWRRLGLGRALLSHAFAEFARRGAREVVLGVDAQSLTGATRLYEGVGMRVLDEQERFELELRPGRDTSTRTLAEDAH